MNCSSFRGPVASPLACALKAVGLETGTLQRPVIEDNTALAIARTSIPRAFFNFVRVFVAR